VILPWRTVPIPGGPPIQTSLTRAEADRLALLAKRRLVLEVGSAYGYSAVVMAQACAQHVLAIDPHDAHNSLSDMQRHLLEHDVADLVTIILAASWQALPALVHARAQFGLVFIDGDHRAETVLSDAAFAWQLVGAGGTLACHDYGEDTCDGVRTALDYTWPDGPDELTDTLWERRRPR
jgi:predicted O-methyltransferase YrrM